MTGKNVTRVELSAAVYETAKLSRFDSSLVDLVLEEITDTLAKGETVKLSKRPGPGRVSGVWVAIQERQRRAVEWRRAPDWSASAGPAREGRL